MKKYYLFSLIFLCLSLGCENEKQNQSLSESLRPFSQIIGKTFKGEFANSTPEKPIYDIVKYDRTLNGNAIRAIHSVNNGEYGGESIIMWDANQESLASWYFTTAGFYTQATLKFEDEKLISIEDVVGNQNGITKVKAILDFLPDGGLHTKSEYLMKGKWVDGHEIHYHEAPDEIVVFK